MTNHVHIIATPQQQDSLAKAIGRTQYLYAQTVNRLHGRTGHLWHSRFYSCVLDDEHIQEAMKYVELNPVRAGICERPWGYKWSSAREHVGEKNPYCFVNLKQWEGMVGGELWKDTLYKQMADENLTKIRVHTRTGRPLGSDSFISKLETKLGRRLRPLHVGRPKINR